MRASKLPKKDEHQAKSALRLIGSKAAAESIGKKMKLTTEQKEALRRSIDDVNAFSELLDEYARTVPLRSLQSKKLDNIERAFHRLKQAIANAGDTLKYALPSAIGDYLARSLTFTAISEATGKARFPRDLARTIKLLLARDKDLTVRELEHHLQRRHRPLGRGYGDLMFKSVIRDLHALIVEGRKAQRQNNTGGKDPSWHKNLVLDLLIKSAKRITGEDATAKSGSRFVELCQEVLAQYHLPTDTLERPIQVRMDLGSTSRA